MSDIYHTEEQLEKIAHWDATQYGLKDLFAYVRSLWAYADCGFWTEYDGVDMFGNIRRYYQVSTAGWSGNEDIIRAMMSNILLWAYTWEQSRRGGHYMFSHRRIDEQG
jgi:hypothetical protein